MNRPAKSLRRKVGEQEKRVTIEVKGEEIPQEDIDEDFSGPVWLRCGYHCRGPGFNPWLGN